MRNNKLYKLFIHTHPIHRLLISLSAAVLVFLFIQKFPFSTLLKTMMLWDVFAFTMILTSWSVIFTRTPNQIRKVAKQEDGSLLYVVVIILIASFASMVTILLLMMTKDVAGAPVLVYLPVTIAGMMLAWTMVHTTFTFHYARVYYSDSHHNSAEHKGGLCFPDEDCPDYLDFAYYAFVIGMTFQVSDVETRTRTFRRLTLLHSILSFGLNTFVVALTINLIASLKA